MSELVLSAVIAFAILAALAVWIPFSGFCNARCQEFLTARKGRRSGAKSAISAAASDVDMSEAA